MRKTHIRNERFQKMVDWSAELFWNPWHQGQPCRIDLGEWGKWGSRDGLRIETKRGRKYKTQHPGMQG